MRKLFNIALLILLIACAGCGGSSAAGDDGGDTPTDTGIRFDISDAVAILKVNEVAADVAAGQAKFSSGNGNLRKLTTSGEIVDLFSSGSIDVSSFFAAPDGTLYLILSTPVNVDGSRCVLLKLTGDNEYECLDSELQSVKYFTQYPTEPIQFDDAGNVYYVGITNDANEVLRKIDSESLGMTEIINDNITVRQFLVLDDGTVYLSGTTNSTDTSFFRRLLSNGSLETLMMGAGLVSLFDMPDGNVYAGEWGSVYGVMRIGDNGIDETRYIGFSNINGQPVPAEFYVDDNAFEACTAGVRADYEDFCAMGGALISSYYQTSDDKYFVVAGSGDGASLWQYWPNVQPVNTSVYRPTIVTGTESSLIIAGYDHAYINKLIMYDTLDHSEIDLLNGENVEIYHFSYSPTSRMIFFDGLRFSDNNYVVGSIDLLNSNEMTVLDSGTTYDDIQILN
jgi:hypothetical protein